MALMILLLKATRNCVVLKAYENYMLSIRNKIPYIYTIPPCIFSFKKNLASPINDCIHLN